MRKLLISILIIVSASLYAQVRLDKPEMYIGANLGVTESMVLFNPSIPQGFLMGYNGGIVFRYIAEKNVGIQVELNFSQRGWTESTNNITSLNSLSNLPENIRIDLLAKRKGFVIDINQQNSTTIYSRQLNYIEIPFMTHIYIGKKNRFFFNIGPKISYLLLESVKTNDTKLTAAERSTVVQHPFDYGICTGLGFLVNIKGKIFQLDTRANYSLSDVFANTKRDVFSTSNNFNLSVNLAWLLKVK